MAQTFQIELTIEGAYVSYNGERIYLGRENQRATQTKINALTKTWAENPEAFHMAFDEVRRQRRYG